jgi:hypothetical protein
MESFLRLTLAFFFSGFLLFFEAGISSASGPDIPLDSSADTGGVFLGLYVLSLPSSSEPDSVGINVSDAFSKIIEKSIPQVRFPKSDFFAGRVVIFDHSLLLL